MTTGTSPARLLYPVHEARQLMGGIGTTLFYDLVKDGEIKLTRVRGRTFVAASELKRVTGEDPHAIAA